jgi:hypothetical protein
MRVSYTQVRPPDVLHDVFISHASEDKDSLVRPLAELLRDRHIEVWYDEFSLKVGDSLRRSIDQGLRQSRFAIVVLSPNFFKKQWSQWELDGLVARQNSGDAEVILPVWHQVGRGDVLNFSPPLADKVAVNSSLGLDEVARRLAAVIHPYGSTLVSARDHLIDYGCAPPVISDDWWLDVASAAESNDLEGGFQEPMGWGRWGFPIPERSKVPADRGWRMACAAMQMMWQEEAESRPITQITHPNLVHEFIASQPALDVTCAENLHYLISYAPQLVIPGFGGAYEEDIEAAYPRSRAASMIRRADGSSFGKALTTDGRSPLCDDEFALRDPEFGRYNARHVACGFVQGNYAANGPPVMYYSHIDYMVWLLSDDSKWLPAPTRETLTRGMAQWAAWPWDSRERRAIVDLGYEDQPFTGAFAHAIYQSSMTSDLRLRLSLSSDAMKDLEHRLAFSASILGISEDGQEICDRLLNSDLLDEYYGELDRQMTMSDEPDPSPGFFPGTDGTDGSDPG